METHSRTLNRTGKTMGWAAALAVAATAGMASLQGAVISLPVNDPAYVYGHNYDGGTPSYSDADRYDRSGGYFASNLWYLNAGTQGYLIYKFEAPAGSTITDLSAKVKTYFEAGSWLSVFYRTTDYTGAPNFADWTDANYSYGGYNSYWTSAPLHPNSNTLYVAYQGGNEGSADYQFQLWADQLTFTVVPEPASLALLALGGTLFLRRRR